MGRPPRGTVEGVKRGPWSPEEDILLAVYIYEHGAGNWPAVPSNAGLRRRSQSCRLRWTNYLRPGINRGDFTPEDDIRIIKLQKLFGNSWAYIASFLPGRTDSDIKNHWNHKLKKKIQNRDIGGQNVDGAPHSEGSNVDAVGATTSSKKLWMTRLQTNVEYAKKALSKALSGSPVTPTCPVSLPLTVAGSSRPPPVSSGLVSFKPSSPNDNKKGALVISDARTSNFSSSYPCTVVNIARLLKKWTEKSDATNAETESQRKGDDFSQSNVTATAAASADNAIGMNDQGTIMNVDKDDNDDNVKTPTLTSTENSPVPLAVGAPVPFPPEIFAVVPFPPPVSVSVPPATALAATPTSTAPASLGGRDEEDTDLPKLRMSIPYDQNVFWPFY